jgi:PTH1 family peptidyl-tRNA hydrolase
MNNSGQAVGEAMRFFKLPAEQVVVLYDDLDLAPGKVKARRGGGHAGHNGIKSMIQHCGPDFWRVRLGIGHPGDKAQVTNWVLSEFAKAEWGNVEDVCRAVGDEIPRLVQGDPEGFMSRVAQQAPPPKASSPKAGSPKDTAAKT